MRINPSFPAPFFNSIYNVGATTDVGSQTRLPGTGVRAGLCRGSGCDCSSATANAYLKNNGLPLSPLCGIAS